MKNSPVRGLLVRISLLLTIAVFSLQPIVSALTPLERRNFSFSDIAFIDDPCPTPGSVAAAIAASETDIANAKIIMGIAKAYNLGKQGALIGLMTAITESHLQNYANSGIPVSKENPLWLALEPPRPLGNDHDSVGIMQQRVSTGWSTFGNGPSQEVTWQLMDPAYAAQAFFGTPPGSTLPAGLKQPSALRKGLQNLDNWQSMDPGEAAQAVQISAFPDRYNDNKEEALGYLNKYWDVAPQLPLPISVTGGEVAQGGEAGVNCIGTGTGITAVLNTIFQYAWPTYCAASRSTCPQYGGDAVPTSGNPAYVEAVRAALKRGEYVGDLCGHSRQAIIDGRDLSKEIGADCGGFVTRVMRDSGADPEYNKYEGNTTAQLKYLRENSGPGGKYREVPQSETLQAGDIAIRADNTFHGFGGHTYFYVGKLLGPNGEPFNGDSASSSQCQRAPMAGPNDDRNVYLWFRLVL